VGIEGRGSQWTIFQLPALLDTLVQGKRGTSRGTGRSEHRSNQGSCLMCSDGSEVGGRGPLGNMANKK